MNSTSLTLANPAIFQRPEVIHQRLRSECPVYRDPVLGLWVVSSDRLIREVVNDPATYSSVPDPRFMAIYSDDEEVAQLYADAGAQRPMNTLVTSDPPQHRRYRSLVEKAVGAGNVRRLRESVCSIADQLIDSFIADGKVEFVTGFALRLPVFILADLLGISREHVAELQSMAESTTRLADGVGLSREQLLECHRGQIRGQHLFNGYIDRYTATPSDNLISHLISAEVDGHPRLTLREIHSTIQALLVGGNDTTPGAISSCLLLIAQNDALQRSLREDGTRIAPFVEEALRLESPVQGMYRFARCDVVLGGTAIPAGASINVRFGSGNLDEAAYERPKEFDLHRKGIRNHLAFGAGIHYCVGNMLARMELSVAIERLLSRLDGIRLEPANFDVRYVDKLVIRNVVKLPIAFNRIASVSESSEGNP
jgi:cytochrome P450